MKWSTISVGGIWSCKNIIFVQLLNLIQIILLLTSVWAR
jgi:hypothetical protein